MTISTIEAFYLQLPFETRLFIGIILVVTLWLHIRFTSKAASFGPTILTTTGILATFIGIAVGLSQFDTSNIQASVPSLLAGLKTAFWASVAGVAGALTLKLRDYVFGHQVGNTDGINDETTAEDLARYLRDIHKGLVGSEDGSLISQLKLSRQDTNDRLDRLQEAQVQALNKLSEMGSKALVEALRDVVRDFNEKITEQFGDNFKQLNIAVGNLLEWQNKYKEIVETSSAELKEITRLTAKSTSDYESLVERSGAFATIAESLNETISKADAQQRQMHVVIDALGKLLLSASGSLPEIEKRVLDLTAQLSSAVSDNQKAVAAALTESAAAMRNTMQSTYQEVSTAQAEYSRQISDMVAKSKEQVSVLDAALSEELQKSLQSLGRQLASLSEKFVSDYGPLTDKLRRVVEIARA